MGKRLIQAFSVVLMWSWVCTSYGLVIGNFEGNMDGWSTTWENNATLALSNVGASSGSKSLAVKLTSGGYWGLQYSAPAVPTLLPGVKLQFDLTMIQAEWTANNWTKVADKVAVNSNGVSGWKEFYPVVTDRITGAAVGGDWGPWNPDALKTYTIDLSDYDTTGATWFQIILSLQQNPIDGTGYFYFDNARLTWEKPAPYFLDDFSKVVDYVIDEPETYSGILDAANILALNASTSKPGALYMQTANGSWSPGPGPMLYKEVTGDFIATVKVTDFEGAMGAQLNDNDCGIGARDPNGAAVNWVSVNYFPTWTAFIARNTTNGDRVELGATAAIWDGADTYALAAQYPYIQLERRGSKFYSRISMDGENFLPLTNPAFKGIYNPNDPNQAPLVIDRPDLPATLQVGLLQCTYTPNAGYAAFDNFKIEVAEPIAILNPSFEDDAAIIEGGTPKDWTGNSLGKSGVSTGTSSTDGTYFAWLGNDCVLSQTTEEFILADGITYVLKVNARNSWQGSPKIALYFEDEAGTHVEMGSATLPANGDTWAKPVTLELAVKTTMASIGKNLGIELSLANYPGNFWAEFDNVRLSVVK
jgi:hypothetical protein